MALHIHENPPWVNIRKPAERDSYLPDVDMTLTPAEQVELLEALARVHGYTLVDHDERKSLTALVDEVHGLGDESYPGMAEAVVRIKGLADALADAVAEALSLTEED